jgi:Lar family restriction alleviation protein
MSQPLLPCPFCGGTDQFVERADYSSCFVQCNCNARGPVGVQSSDDEETPGRDDAITEWNRRTEPSPAEVGSEGLVDFAIEIFDMSKDGGADLTSVREYAERFAESRLSQQSPARVEGGE